MCLYKEEEEEDLPDKTVSQADWWEKTNRVSRQAGVFSCILHCDIGKIQTSTSDMFKSFLSEKLEETYTF